MGSAAARTAELNAQRVQKELAIWGTTESTLPEKLDSREVWWRDRYKQLNARGYRLRPRYSPEWVPSWTNSKRNWRVCEDGKRLEFGQIIDATRLSDGKVVALKTISRKDHPHEVDIALYFASDSLASQPANHCVPVYEVLTLDGDGDDDDVLLVMPLLRPYTDPYYDTVGEGVECFRQLFEAMFDYALLADRLYLASKTTGITVVSLPRDSDAHAPAS